MTEQVAWYGKELLFGFSVAQIWVFLTPLIAAGLAALATDLLRRNADRQRKKEQWLAKQLEEAFHLVVEAIEHPGMPKEMAFERKLKLEKALNSAHLYGDDAIRAAADKIIDGFARNDDWILYTSLLKELRDAFRRNMGLPAVEGEVRSIKFNATANVAEKVEETEEK